MPPEYDGGKRRTVSRFIRIYSYFSTSYRITKTYCRQGISWMADESQENTEIESMNHQDTKTPRNTLHFRHTGEGRYPAVPWMPAFAGMPNVRNLVSSCLGGLQHGYIKFEEECIFYLSQRNHSWFHGFYETLSDDRYELRECTGAYLRRQTRRVSTADSLGFFRTVSTIQGLTGHFPHHHHHSPVGLSKKTKGERLCLYAD